MWELLSAFGWVDLVDVLIVAVTIYQLLLVFRGTKAIEMLLGLALVYLASRVSFTAGLLTVNWILQNLLAVWFLVIIIVFQPELRRALANFGQRSAILRAFARYGEAHTIDELVRAAVSLSAKKVGALVVVERETRLADYVDVGVDVDAALSRHLLETIFFPNSPLHDGALIINRGRVASAGCFLPLTLNPAVSKDLGTRHRAAIGITEETDAVAVVVSEETGTISVVREGEIERGFDGVSLRRRLEEILEPAAARRAVEPIRQAAR